jgi:ankyrin repeat protein
LKLLLWNFIIILVFQTTLALAYYDPYGGSSYSYSRYGSSQRNQVISLDFDQKDILNSSFRIAAREDRLTDLQTDLLQGANINSLDDEGQTALMYTARNCTTASASFLLRGGADPNVQDKVGRSALMYAVMESCLPIVHMLLHRHGTSLNVEDRSGRTAFNYAEDAASLDVDGPSVDIKQLLYRALRTHQTRALVQSARTR